MKVRLIGYKSLFLIMCIVLSFTISLLAHFIYSSAVGVNLQKHPHLQQHKSLVSRNQDISSASCSQIHYKLPKTYRNKNPEEQIDFEEAVFVQPPNPHGATKVDIGLYVMNISNVNAVENTYRLEGLINLVWCDRRLQHQIKDKYFQKQTYLEEDAALKIKRIWFPSITFANEVGEFFRKNQELIIFVDGTVEYQEKFSVELKSFFDLTKFPFDEQTLDVEIESFAWNEKYLKLHREEKKIGFNPNLNLPEWKIGDLESQIKQKQEIREEEPFSKFLMHIKLIRKPGFYLWKIIIPLVILVMISWSVFWMAEENLADRISFSLTGILTVVAYQFLISENLPNISYLTLMDAILSLSFVIIALTVAENIVINGLNVAHQKLLAVKLDRICRLAFPTIYVVLLFALSFSYLAD